MILSQTRVVLEHLERRGIARRDERDGLEIWSRA
jgi:hypothetical protein